MMKMLKKLSGNEKINWLGKDASNALESISRRMTDSQCELEVQLDNRIRELHSLNDNLMKEEQLYRETEEALRESEERYRLLFNEMSEGFALHEIICDNSGKPVDYRFLDVNPAFERLTSLKKEEILQRKVSEVLPGLEPQWVEIYGRVALTGNPEQFSDYTVSLDRYYDVFAYCPRLGQFAVLFMDAASRLNAANALQESEQKYRMVFDTAPNLIALLDPKGYILECNRRVKGFLGYEPQEIMGRHMGEFIRYENSAVSMKLWEELIAEGYSHNKEFILIKNDGSFVHATLSLSMTYNAEGKVDRVICIAEDRTEAIRAKAEIEELNRGLEHRVKERTSQLADLNRELETFSYSVSHDLKAPLRAIEGFCRILLEDYAPCFDDEGRRYASIIMKNVSHMSNLINDLLAFSRMGRTQIGKTTVPMQDLTRAVFEELRLIYPERDIRLQLEPLPDTYGDPSMLRQVMENLLSNAMKFTRIRPVSNITVGFEDRDHEVVYFVRDNGVGFDMKYAGKLFGVFQRLHAPDEYEGTGVGLAIIQRIIFRHGGRVWADARLNEGAEFGFALPKPAG